MNRGLAVGSVVALSLLAARTPAQPPQASSSPWQPVSFLAGDWQGESEGEPGTGSVRRAYRFVLKDKFLEEQNVSTYPPQPKNPKGEIHEHRTFFSYDRARRQLVFRQFHQEGFVNQYVMRPQAAPDTIVFDSEALENVPTGWQARVLDWGEVRSFARRAPQARAPAVQQPRGLSGHSLFRPPGLDDEARQPPEAADVPGHDRQRGHERGGADEDVLDTDRLAA